MRLKCATFSARLLAWSRNNNRGLSDADAEDTFEPESESEPESSEEPESERVRVERGNAAFTGSPLDHRYQSIADRPVCGSMSATDSDSEAESADISAETPLTTPSGEGEVAISEAERSMTVELSYDDIFDHRNRRAGAAPQAALL